MSFVDIVFDGPPGREAGRFVEVENPQGHSIQFGEWVDRGDGTWALRVDAEGQLERILRLQRELQTRSFGTDPAELTDAERTEYIRWNALALTDELHEALAEVGWKPWATSNHVNVDAALKELVDLLHFYVNIVWAVGGMAALGDAGVLAGHLTELYESKREVNAARQASGYDGVAGKCPHCKRAFDDVGVDRAVDGSTICVGCGCGSRAALEHAFRN